MPDMANETVYGQFVDDPHECILEKYPFPRSRLHCLTNTRLVIGSSRGEVCSGE